MEGMNLKFTPVIVRHLLGPLACLGLWLAPLGLIASLNNPNRGYNPPLATHHPPQPLPAHPLYAPRMILQWL